MKSKVRVMGKFESAPAQSKKPKVCKGCGRPVSETVGGLGYCKKCIKLAREEQKGKVKHGNNSRDKS